MKNIEDKIVIYQTEDGHVTIDVRLENETVWLTTNQMALLFDREESNIRSHILNVFKEKELSRENNVHFLHVNGVKKPVPFYSLDVIISVGYRVKSQRGTQFRIWANSVLKQMLVKGYVVSNKLTEQKYKEPSQVVQLLGRTIETHRRHAVHLVLAPQRHPLRRRRPQAHRRQHLGGLDADDCRESLRRKRCDGKGGGEPHQPEQRVSPNRFDFYFFCPSFRFNSATSSLSFLTSSSFSRFTECLNFSIARFSSKEVSLLWTGNTSVIRSSTICPPR